MIITSQNLQNFPILSHSPAILSIADQIEPKLNFQDLTGHSAEEICSYSKTLNALMLSCKSLGHKEFLKKRMSQLKECYKEKVFLDWNKKYPLFSNSWTPKSNKHLEDLFSDKKLNNANDIAKEFPLIRQPRLILELFKWIDPLAPRLHDLDNWGSKPIEKTMCALRGSCKALYNCNLLQEHYNKVKEKALIRDFKIIKIGNKIYNFPGGPGHLQEIFLTGWKGYYSGSRDIVYVGDRTWNTVLEEDAKKIIKLYPESLLSLTLNTRLVDHVSPFVLACMNKHIPLSMIEFLLENRADPNMCAQASGGLFPWHWQQMVGYVSDENPGVIKERFEEIVRLVKKHKLSFSSEIVVNYNPGFGNNLFIRGSEEIYSLCWKKGKPLINISANSWIYLPQFEKVDCNFEFKILINDIVWEKDVSETEKNHQGRPGQQLSIEPRF